MSRFAVSRRDALRGAALLAGGALLGGATTLASCARTRGSRVTVYTSADAFIAQPVVRAAEKSLGLSIVLVTDTEATKTTGLVQRMLIERSKPVADVWWSSEALGTVALAREGLLASWTPTWLETEFAGRWPLDLVGHDRTWYGMGLRARVIAFHTGRMQRATAPRSIDALCDPRLRGRVGLARPQFGTTRSHVAGLVALRGDNATREVLARFAANKPRVYEGNSAVVQGLATGEVDVGLTDTDDVWAGQANGWPVDCVFEASPSDAARSHAIIIPNTVGVLHQAPNRRDGLRVADFLVSAEAEMLLARTESRNVPVRAGLAAELARSDSRLAFPEPAPVAWATMDEAMRVGDRLIGEFFPI